MKDSFATGGNSRPEGLEPHATVFHDANNPEWTKEIVVLVKAAR